MSSSTELLIDGSYEQPAAEPTNQSIPFVHVPTRVGPTWAEENGREIPYEEAGAICHFDPNLGEGVMVHAYGPGAFGRECRDHRCGKTDGERTMQLLKCGHEVFLYTEACSLDCMNPRWMLKNGAIAQAPQVYGCDYCGIPYLPEQNLLITLEEFEFYFMVEQEYGFSAKVKAQLEQSNNAAWAAFWEDHPERFDPEIIQLATRGETPKLHDLFVEQLKSLRIAHPDDSEGEEDIEEYDHMELDDDSDDERAAHAGVSALP